MEEFFIFSGGDVNWLITGIESVPEKLRNLGKINNILAHQPWKLDLAFIQDIYKFENSKCDSCWNFNELVHACLIMIKFHKLASIFQAFGINIRLNKCNPININIQHTDKSNLFLNK